MSWIRRETEKETVQYICPHCHDYHEFREGFGERTFSENYIFCRRCGARNGTGNAPTLTQPNEGAKDKNVPTNEPLTLEELREMDEPTPVWWKKAGYWCLCERGFIITPNGNIYEFEENNWTFYRRPPEGEA